MEFNSILLVYFVHFLILQIFAENNRYNEIKGYHYTETLTLDLKVALINDYGNNNNDTETVCKSCQTRVSRIINLRRKGANKNSVLGLLRQQCYASPGQSPIYCDGWTQIEIDTILYIIDNSANLSPQRVCSIYMQNKGCVDLNAKKWSVHLPEKIVKNKNLAKNNNSDLAILHLTDFHFDPLYKPGAEADCGLPLCCQAANGPPKGPDSAAGYWGDYHPCDTPLHAITNFLQHLSKSHENLDFIYYTGDIICHRTWATSKDQNMADIKQLHALFKQYFPETIILPVLGNHEPHPAYFFAPGNVTSEKITTQWLLDLAAEEWTSKWLPQTTESTIKRGGFYTVLLKPGFRLVALNSNVCYTPNLWLILNDEDPYGELQWLIEVLQMAEENGEYVHILSHVPPGEADCLQQWTHEYNRIVNRFSAVIAAQFNGHSHLDEIRFFHDLEQQSRKIVNVAFNAGSFTTFIGLNPNYRLYKIRGNDFKVDDFDHFTFNLTKANENGIDSPPEWYKLYQFRRDYNLKSGDYDQYETLLDRMENNQTLVQQYYRFLVRESAPWMKEGCDEKCQKQLVCSLTAVEATDKLKCIYKQ